MGEEEQEEEEEEKKEEEKEETEQEEEEKEQERGEEDEEERVEEEGEEEELKISEGDVNSNCGKLHLNRAKQCVQNDPSLDSYPELSIFMSMGTSSVI